MKERDLDDVCVPLRMPKGTVIHVGLTSGRDFVVLDAEKVAIVVRGRHANALKAQLEYLVRHFEDNLDPRLEQKDPPKP